MLAVVRMTLQVRPAIANIDQTYSICAEMPAFFDRAAAVFGSATSRLCDLNCDAPWQLTSACENISAPSGHW